MSHFKDKIAIVTGGASGIGRALCHELGRDGAVVITADINIKKAREVALDITRAGGQAQASSVDVTRAEAVQKLVDETVAQYRRLDYMFNNSGVATIGEVRDLSLQDWQQVLNVNLWGVVYGTHAAYQVMAKQGYGHIVNMASCLGLIPNPTLVPYVASKYAVVGLSESLRIEASDLGVHVSVACPGYVQTRMFDASPTVGASLDDVLPAVPFKVMDATACARRILRGVAHNRAVIAFPFYVRLLMWCHRFLPGVAFRMNLREIRDFRKIRHGV